MKKLLLLSALIFSTILFSQEGNLKGSCVSGNCKNGFGKFVYENGTFYEGKFKKGKFEGIGTEIYADGTKVTAEFKDGGQEGQAKIICADGNIWEGKSIYNNPNGYGKMIYLNGSQYIGEMDRWYKKNGEGIYSLKSGYYKKGMFVEGAFNTEGKIEKFEYFNSENQKITREMFDAKEKGELTSTNEQYVNEHDAKIQQYILKNKGVVVQNINIPITNPTDFSNMSFRTSDIDLLFSNGKDNLFCIIRQAIRPSSYDFNNDQITAFSTSSQKRIFSGSIQNFEETEAGKFFLEKMRNNPKANEFKPNYSDETVKKIIDDLNILTAPAGNVEFEIANENQIIFKDLHRLDKDTKTTYYFINKISNLCEKIVTVNGKYIDLVWNEDFTKSCIKLNSKLPESLVPDVYKFGYYSSLYVIDWETFQIKFIDDHDNQLNYLALAKSDKLASDISYQQYNAKVAAINRENNEIESQNSAAQAERTAKCQCCHGTGLTEVKGMYMGEKTYSVTPVNGTGISHDETRSSYGQSTYVKCSCCRK
ncbi:hypothetical protein QWY90_11875 [Flavobacterium paronense]|uniref:MORN repeat protein n=1 Tax=Flavobacterium paronense TaxID=1392775 RepID=A0ABV5GEY0_9FLAO|nr:hypothetical protein [Flavobacterium paronense]MDN3678004.1 hypothetical protein [Flavobacterium paronense]